MAPLGKERCPGQSHGPVLPGWPREQLCEPRWEPGQEGGWFEKMLRAAFSLFQLDLPAGSSRACKAD